MVLLFTDDTLHASRCYGVKPAAVLFSLLYIVN